MSSAVTLPRLTAASPAAAAGECFHCGESLDAAAVSDRQQGRQRDFCCSGCAAAARWIHDSQLDDYYRLRSDAAGRAIADSTDLTGWDDEALLATHARTMPAGREIVLLTDGMRCAACAWLIDRALVREPGVREVCANAVTGRIRIAWDPQEGKLSAPLRRLLALGYRPFLAGDAARERARRSERNRWLLRIGLAGLATMQAMMFAEALYLDSAGAMPAATRDFFRWITFLVATPVVFWSGWPFLAGAARELRLRTPGMDTLIAGSALLAWGASVIETLRGGPHVWFDAAVMFVFLLLAARMLEQRARALASARVDALAHAQPLLATRETPAGGLETVPVSRLRVGDIARIAGGETVPADGLLLDAPAAFVESLLTGESRPVAHQPGDCIHAGTVCANQLARIGITATGTATRLSTLAQLVNAAQETRPRLARLADRVASRFVVALLLAALLTGLAWVRIDASRAFEITLAMLVISCPCALSLSIPAALAAAHGALSHLGVLAVRPDALETLARVTDVVFDKTGTLGDGQWTMKEVQPFGNLQRDEALQLAEALERDVRHPLASAFRHVHTQRIASAVHSVAGQGIEGEVEGRLLRLGTAPFATGGVDDAAIWLGDGRHALARFTLCETARADASATLQELRAAGLTVHLCSGDSHAAVATFADSLGLAESVCHGRQTPEAKLAHVRALQAQQRIVAMVGDGLNDAPVLAGADVSLAVAGGASLAQGASDLVLTHAPLRRIAQTFTLARRTRRIIRQNLALALGYNVLALPLAAAGFVQPWIAALAMVASSLTVTLNALRLARGSP